MGNLLVSGRVTLNVYFRREKTKMAKQFCEVEAGSLVGMDVFFGES